MNSSDIGYRDWSIGRFASACLLSAAALVLGCGGGSGGDSDSGSNAVTEFALEWPQKASTPPESQGSTHEIIFNKGGPAVFWITAPHYDAVATITPDGTRTYHQLPDDTAPHGIDFDSDGELWVALEGTSQIGRLNSNGELVETYDLPSSCTGCDGPVTQDPHGLGIGADGRSIWYSGKTSNTIGRIVPDGTIVSFAVPTTDSFPIYIRLGPDGNMWFTELTGNKIGRVTDAGQIDEFPIPTANSRPIAIVPEPEGDGMWFSEEKGNNVARVDPDGTITEFAVPKLQANMILAGLAFDSDKNLWVQQYVDRASPEPVGPDYIIRIDRKILSSAPSELTSEDFTFFTVPSQGTVMHRIIAGPDGNMWFTELKTDIVGRVER